MRIELNSCWIAVLVLAILSTLGCELRIPDFPSKEIVRGNGVVITHERAIEDFQSIEVSGALEIQVTCDAEPSLVIRGDENILEIIETKVSDGKLVIRSTDSYSSSHPVIIKTRCSKLARYQGHGATKGAVAELISDDFEVDVYGASSFLLQKGTIGQLKASASGASSIDAKNAEATVAKATATGASKIVLSVSDKLTAKSSGASTIIYLGSPISLDKASSGASSVAQRK